MKTIRNLVISLTVVIAALFVGIGPASAFTGYEYTGFINQSNSTTGVWVVYDDGHGGTIYPGSSSYNVGQWYIGAGWCTAHQLNNGPWQTYHGPQWMYMAKSSYFNPMLYRIYAWDC